MPVRASCCKHVCLAQWYYLRGGSQGNLVHHPPRHRPSDPKLGIPVVFKGLAFCNGRGGLELRESCLARMVKVAACGSDGKGWGGW